MTRIEVTAEDIENGDRSACETCPIARAAARAGLEMVNVGRHTISWGPSWRNRRALPPAACSFAIAFDLGEPVQPFAFDLDVTP